MNRELSGFSDTHFQCKRAVPWKHSGKFAEIRKEDHVIAASTIL